MKYVYVLCQIANDHKIKLGRIEPRRITRISRTNIQYVQLWSPRKREWNNSVSGYHKSFIRFATYEDIKRITGHDPLS